MYKKNILFVILIVFSLLFSYCISSFWITDKLQKIELTNSLTLSGKEEFVNYSIKDFNINTDKSIVALSHDPNISVVLNEPIFVEEIELICNVADADDITRCQIFYATEPEYNFSEANSISLNVSDGSFIFDLPDEEYSKFRFDVTNENGTVVKIDNITFYENRNDFRFLPAFFVFSLVLIILIYVIIYGNSSKISLIKRLYSYILNISDTRKAKALLFISILITCVFVYGKILISDNMYVYTDTGSDTIETYIPSIKNAVDSIKNWDFSFLTLEYGLGSTYYSKFTYFFDPFFILTIILSVIFGSEAVPFFLILTKVISIFVVGTIAFKYFSLFSDKTYLVSIASYLYSFNSFSIIWGQHYQLSTYSLYAIASFYLVELYLRKRQDGFYLPLIIISFLVMINTVYLVYMIYLIAAVYSIIRYIMLNDKFFIKKFVVKFFNLALNIIIGFIGGLTLSFGYFQTILFSGRVNSSTTSLEMLKSFLGEWYFPDRFFDMLKFFISPNAHGSALSYNSILGNYYESPKLYLTVISILLVIQYISNIHKNGNLKTKICSYISCLLVFFAVFNVGGGYIMYALAQKSFRYTFALLPIISIAVLIALENIVFRKQFNKLGFIISIALTCYLLFDSLEQITDWVIYNIYISIIIFVIACYLILNMYLSNNSLKNTHMSILLMLVLLINTTSESYVSVNFRKPLNADTWNEINNNSASKIVEHLGIIDTELYRIDTNALHKINFNSSLFYGFNSISVYDSVLKLREKQFYKEYMNNTYMHNHQKYRFSNSEDDLIQYSMLGLKYVLLSSPPLDIENYTKIESFEGVNLYRINATESFTTFYDNAVAESEFLNLDYSDKTKILSKAIVLQDDYISSSGVVKNSITDIISNIEETTLEECIEEPICDENNIVIPLATNWSEGVQDVIFFEADISLSKSENFNMYFDLGDGPVKDYVNTIKPNGQNAVSIRYILPQKTQKIVFNTSIDNIKLENVKVYSVLDGIRPMGNASTIIDDNNESVISGTITCENDGYMLLPIWYNDNWKVYIDGTESEILVANSSLMAVKLSKGEHEFVFKYIPVELYIGFICFASSLIMGFVYWFISRKVWNRKNM